MQQPLISVVMPVCNGEKFLSDSIESILNQSFSDFEFIIIENGSTDSSWQIIKSYSDPRIKAIRSSIKQVGYNLNLGIMNSVGKYIARMDCDDISDIDRLRSQFEFLEKNSDIAVVGSAFQTFGTDVKEKIIQMPETDSLIRRKLPFRFCFCHPSVMFKREVVLNYGGYWNFTSCEDLDLWLRLSRNANIKFANLHKVFLKYRIHPGQVKGKKETYIDMAGLMLRESLLRKSPKYFCGFIISLLKILLK
jgi:glycosyltransferase involved in cell wall biosynthesis